MSILDSAELLLQAKNYSGTGAWLDEANSHDAQLGSTSGADTNDPLFKDHTGFNYCVFPGATGHYASVPDISNLDGTGTLEVIAKVNQDDWTPGADQVYISKWTGSAGYLFMMESDTNDLQFIWHEGSARIAEATETPTVTDGNWLWVRAVATEDGNERDVVFYTSTDTTNDPDNVTWTQLGNEVVITDGAGDLTTNTAAVFVGAQAAGTKTIAGSIAAARVVLNGTVQLDVDFNDATAPFATFTERSANAATVTITGTGTTVVNQDMFLLTTDDYFEIADDAGLDFSGSQDLTVMAAFRANTVAAGSDVLIGKKDNLTTSLGWSLFRAGSASKGVIADGTLDDDDQVTTIAINTLHTGALVRNTTDDDIEVFIDGIGSGSATPDSTTTTLANAFPVRIGATSNTAAAFWEGQIVAVAVWRSALTDGQIADAHTLLTVGAAGHPHNRNVTAGQLLLTG